MSILNCLLLTFVELVVRVGSMHVGSAVLSAFDEIPLKKVSSSKRLQELQVLSILLQARHVGHSWGMCLRLLG